MKRKASMMRFGVGGMTSELSACQRGWGSREWLSGSSMPCTSDRSEGKDILSLRAVVSENAIVQNVAAEDALNSIGGVEIFRSDDVHARNHNLVCSGNQGQAHIELLRLV